MKKAHELPQAVNNLRAIWDAKKAEMKFTQVEAAAELGWSQGAISHYLNNITDLGPAAVIKFANFLGVDPLDIDPSVISHLPNTRALKVKRNSSNFNKVIDETYYHARTNSGMNVVIGPDTLLFEPGAEQGTDFSRSGETTIIKVCDPEEAPGSSYYLIQLKNERQANFYHHACVPKENKIKRIYAVNFVAWLTENRLRGPSK